MEGRSYIFLKSFEGDGGEFEILWGNVFLGSGVGREKGERIGFWVMYGKE